MWYCCEFFSPFKASTEPCQTLEEVVLPAVGLKKEHLQLNKNNRVFPTSEAVKLTSRFDFQQSLRIMTEAKGCI